MSAVTAPLSVPSVPMVIDGVNPKKREAVSLPEEQERNKPEAKHYAFDPELLLSTIKYKLEHPEEISMTDEEETPLDLTTAIVNQIVMEDPEILNKLCHHSSKQLLHICGQTIPLVIQESVPPASDSHEICDPSASINLSGLSASTPAAPGPNFGRLLGSSQFLNHSRYTPEVQQVLKQLASLSFRNSKYNETAKELNKEITSYLPRSEKKHFNDLIIKARAALDQDPATIRHVCGEINKTLGLFFHIDFENPELIEEIYTTSVHFNGQPLFPNCKTYFPRLRQNLQICQKERDELIALRKQLTAKLMPSASQASGASSSHLILATDQDTFYWQLGCQFIEKVFRQTFQEKHERKIFIPDDIVSAIRKTAGSNKDWESFSFHRFLYAEVGKIPEAFTSSVWMEYLGKNSGISDLGEFMKQVFKNLPPPTLQKINNDRSNAVNTLLEFFKGDSRQEVTLMTLKRWFDKTKNRG